MSGSLKSQEIRAEASFQKVQRQDQSHYSFQILEWERLHDIKQRGSISAIYIRLCQAVSLKCNWWNISFPGADGMPASKSSASISSHFEFSDGTPPKVEVALNPQPPIRTLIPNIYHHPTSSEEVDSL
jgi:hypothetical protein